MSLNKRWIPSAFMAAALATFSMATNSADAWFKEARVTSGIAGTQYTPWVYLNDVATQANLLSVGAFQSSPELRLDRIWNLYNPGPAVTPTSLALGCVTSVYNGVVQVATTPFNRLPGTTVYSTNGNPANGFMYPAQFVTRLRTECI